ncbi:hypothetical protein F5Y09DRAFT_125613 [Xylaria sp. FL1042]|nr:hypothetical protein F5Y09DRAFT_125613 [Xylaria sp. FL1042]
MMDPITIVSLAASAGSLVSQIIKAKSALSELHEKFKTAQLAVSSLIAQLSALEASTSELEAILKDREKSLWPARSLQASLNQSLSSCGDVIQYLLERLAELTGAKPAGGRLGRFTRARFALNESELAPMKEALRDQVQAIQLLITVASLQHEDAQETVLNDKDSVRVLRTAAKRSSSLLWLRDSMSILSFSSFQSDTLSRLSMIFNFDGELLESKSYRAAVLKTWKGLKEQRNVASNSDPPKVARDNRISMFVNGRSDAHVSYQLSGMKLMVAMIARYDFVAERADELEFKAGEVLIPVAITNKEWVVVKPVSRLGGPGLVPTSYMTLISRTGERYTSPEDIERELRAVEVPNVRDWKRFAAKYVTSAIPPGKITATSNGLGKSF